MTSTTRIVAVLVHFSHRYFVWILGFSYIVAALLPEFGLRIRNVSVSRVDVVTSNLVFSLPAFLLALLLFNAGLGVRTAELKRLSDRPSVLAGAAFGNLAVPLAFIIAISFPMKYWHNPDEVQQILVGLALVVSMPIAGASTAWAQNAHGNLALSLSLVLATTTLSPLLTPLLLHAVGFITTGDYAEDLHELAADGTVGFLGAWVIVPSLLGILSNLALGEHRIAAVMPYVKLLLTRK